MNPSTTLTGKDLITVGIYATFYFFFTFFTAFLGFIPIFIPLLTALVPLAGAIPFMLFVSKTKKFGMVTLMGFIIGVLMLLTGMGPWALLTGTGFAAMGDAIMGSGRYRNPIKNIIGCGVFSMWVFGNFIAFFVGRDAHFVLIAQDYGSEYALRLQSYMPLWIMPVLLVTSFVFGLLGGYIGKRVCKKHFERAGIA